MVSGTSISARIRAGMPILTSLRFFAALSVLFFHFGAGAAEEAGAPSAIVSILKNGYLGVTFFFILSGFILTCSYTDRLGSLALLREYAVSRIARVYPVYLIGLLLTAPFLLASRVMPNWQTLFLLQSWTLPGSELGTQWNMPAWTLSIELFFYLTFPFFNVFVLKMPKWALVVSAIALASLIATLNLPSIAPGSPIKGLLAAIPLPLLRLPEFCLGVTLAQLLLASGETRCPRWASTAMLGCAALIVALMATGWRVSGLISLCFAALITLAAISDGAIQKLLAGRLLVMLGASSYALYLLQIGVHSIIEHAFTRNFAVVGRIIFPVILVLVALVVFQCIEEPARKYIKNRLKPSAPVVG